MKLDKDCIRAVLIYIEDHCIFETDKFGERTMHIIGFHELTESNELSGFHEDNIRYTIVKLLEGRYIEGSFIPKNSGLNFHIVQIT